MLTCKPWTVSDVRRLLDAARTLPNCGHVVLAGDTAHAESATYTNGAGDPATLRLSVSIGLQLRGKPVAVGLRELRKLAKAPAGCVVTLDGSRLVAARSRALGLSEQVCGDAEVTEAPPTPYTDRWLTGRRTDTSWADVWRIAHAAHKYTAGRPALAGVFVGPSGMVASDPYRLAAVGDPRGAEQWVPSAAVRALDALRVDPAKVEGGTTWLGTPSACVSWTQEHPRPALCSSLADCAERVRNVADVCTLSPDTVGILRGWGRRVADVDRVELHTDGTRVLLVPFVDGRPTADVDAGTMLEASPQRVLVSVNPTFLADVLAFTECAPLRIGDPLKPFGAVRGDAVAVTMPMRISVPR